MSDSFIDKVRKNIIKSPTHRDFNLSKWESAWKEAQEKRTCDNSLYDIGIYTHKVMSNIRLRLDELYAKHYPDIDDNKLLQAFIALSNRERHIVTKHLSDTFISDHSPYVANMSSELTGNVMTPQEVAIGCVDMFSKAISTCQMRIIKKKQPKLGTDPISPLDFIVAESMLAQLYELHEGYYNSVLWSDFNFIKPEGNHNQVILEQPFIQSELMYETSQIRKQRLQGHAAIYSFSKDIQKTLGRNDAITLENRYGQRVLSVQKNIQDEGLQADSTTIKGDISLLLEEFPSEFLLQKNDLEFTLLEAFNVFRLLILLSSQLADRFPKKNDAETLSKLLHYCPKIKKSELVAAIVKTLELDYIKVNNILSFIEYNATKKHDIWCHPIIPIGNSHYAFLTSALITPVISRVAEHWFEEVYDNMHEKGFKYERTVAKKLISTLSSNLGILNYDLVESRVISTRNGKEEIDLIIRIEELILVCEIKSIVTTDSPISKRRTLDTLSHGARQAARKAKYIADNINEISINMGWNIEDTSTIIVERCVITSSKIYSGLTIEDTPIVDLKILNKYFSSSSQPILSTINKDMESIHYISIIFYENFDEMKKNLGRYLRKPPQLLTAAGSFEYRNNIIPPFADSPMLVHRSIVMKPFGAEQILKMEHGFKMHVREDLQKFIDNSRIKTSSSAM